MEQRAKVISVSGNQAIIEVRRKTACGHDCDNCHGCSSPDETIRVSAFNECNAKNGDDVIITSSSKQILGLAALLYIMPLVLMFLGYILSTGSEAVKITFSLLGLLMGIGICFLVSQKMKKGAATTFTISYIDNLQ